jgi:hypothetical protein
VSVPRPRPKPWLGWQLAHFAVRKETALFASGGESPSHWFDGSVWRRDLRLRWRSATVPHDPAMARAQEGRWQVHEWQGRGTWTSKFMHQARWYLSSRWRWLFLQWRRAPAHRLQLGLPNARADNAAMGIRTRGLDISINAKRQEADRAARAEAKGVVDRGTNSSPAAGRCSGRQRSVRR